MGKYVSNLNLSFRFSAIAETDAVKNIQKALTARILKRLDDGQPLVEAARKMQDMEARLARELRALKADNANLAGQVADLRARNDLQTARIV
jgi:plasmid maintenance system killer protein